MPYNVIEAFDQPWKRAQEGTAGGYWGIFDVHASPSLRCRGRLSKSRMVGFGWLAGVAGAGCSCSSAAGAAAGAVVRGWLALDAAGIRQRLRAGLAVRQMWFACRNPWEWTLSIAACALALLTALQLARWIAAPGGYRERP
jgi:hypothetical protein